MNYAFVTGMGRSGTKFLAELLSMNPECRAHHEYIGSREFSLLSWYLAAGEYTIPYLKRARRRIESQPEGAHVLIDVNSYLQNAVPALKEVFEEPPVIHLVRDPRKVIPSIYTRRHDRDVHRLPKQPDEIRWWLEADKFEQICWNWAEATRRLRKEADVTLRFEDVLKDFSYFAEHLAKPIGIEPDRRKWLEMKAKKVNRTRPDLLRYAWARLKGVPFEKGIPRYEHWSKRMKDSYERICGDVAAELGYA